MAVILLRRKNYLAMIENAAKGRNCLFRNTYAHLEGDEHDITHDGVLSSGRFVSSILYLNKLVGDMHVTVEGTERDMTDSGWQETQRLRDGCVLIWEPIRRATGNLHTHIGFYVGNDEAVSNDTSEGIPHRHHVTFGIASDGRPARPILRAYWHPALDQY